MEDLLKKINNYVLQRWSYWVWVMSYMLYELYVKLP